MNFNNCTVSITKLSGDENNRTYVTLEAEISANLQPVGTDIAILYPDLPVGSMYSLLIFGDVIMPAECLITILTSKGEHTVGDQYVTKGNCTRQRFLGKMVTKANVAKTS